MSKVTYQPFPSFGLRLRRQRRALGLKQSAFAHEMGVNQTTISRWESNENVPNVDTQQEAFGILTQSKTNDMALRRLVESSSDCVHLIEDVSHICLAYSEKRARDWLTSQNAMLGVSLWQFATDEIRQAESELTESDWWEVQTPRAKQFCTAEAYFDDIKINACAIQWERLYLADGTPVRLVKSIFRQ